MKIICGISNGKVLAPGEYWTAINVHNPTSDKIKFKKRIVVALPNEQAGPVTEFFDAELGPDEALEIDREDIFRRLKKGTEFIKGFVIIHSSIELDIVAVYTATGKDSNLEAMHMERVSHRRYKSTPVFEGEPDLIPVPNIKGHYCDIRDDVLVVTVKN